MYGESAWKDAAERLRQIRRDDEVTYARPGPDTDPSRARSTAAELYVRYILASNELTACHDSIIQPQVRILIKKMLMCTYGRILELKQMLIDADSSIYTPVDEELIRLKMTHDRFELKVPRCFRDERRSFLEEMDYEIDEIHRRIAIENNNLSEVHEEGSEVGENSSNTTEQISQESSVSEFDVATFLNNEQQQMPQKIRDITNEEISIQLAKKFVQKHIRAQRDRVIGNELLAAKITRENIISGKYVEPSVEKSGEAATKIQRYWRFYRMMKTTKVREDQKNILIGLHLSGEETYYNDSELKQNKIRVQQTEAALKFSKTIDKLQKKLEQSYRYEIIEEIEDELRAYIRTYFERCKHLPAWPDPKPIIFTDNSILGLPPIILPESILKQLKIQHKLHKSALNQKIPLGGSAIFHTGNWMTIEMAEILAPLIVEFENKPAKERKQLTKEWIEKKKIEKEQNNAKNAVKTTNKKGDLSVIPEPSELTEQFKETFYEFDSDWTIDNGIDGEPREDLIKTDMFGKAQIELRAMVDTTIKEEFERIRKAYARDLKKKYKPPKKKSTKSKTRDKKNKSVNPKEILEELVRNGMLEKSVSTKFKDFQGEMAYSVGKLRGEPYYFDPPYGLGDVRQMIKECCVIGLIFPELRALKKIKPSHSLLIAGPEKSGKSMLINAICTETGSLKIELTLKNVADNYSDLKQIKRFVGKIVEFIKINQPVVIEVDLADVPFYKKIPDNLKLYKPQLMGKTLLQLLKSFGSTERVIIIGKSTNPWLTSKIKLRRAFKTVLFTVSDYNTSLMFLYELLMRYPMVSRAFPVTALMSLLADYPRQVVADIVTELMTKERELTLKHKPLDPKEFIPVMMKYPKRVPGLCDRYHSWYKQFAPMGGQSKIDNGKEKDKSKR